MRNAEKTFPRQTGFIVILILAMIITWCASKAYYDRHIVTDHVILQLDSSLQQANHFLVQNTKTLSLRMDDKINDPARREKAVRWKPICDKVVLLSNQTLHDIEQCELKTKTNYKDNHQVSANYFIENLISYLKKFSMELIQLIPPDKRESMAILPIQKFASMNEDYPTNFFKMQLAGKHALLTKLKYDVLASTDVILQFINDQNSRVIFDDWAGWGYQVLTTQNATCLLPGQTLEITAGIGLYDATVQPVITINNKQCPVTDNGNSIYRKVILDTKGDSVPVVISFKDPNTGETRTKSTMIKYTVLQPPNKDSTILP